MGIDEDPTVDEWDEVKGCEPAQDEPAGVVVGAAKDHVAPGKRAGGRFRGDECVTR